ncbi:MAG: MBL fold metallo-hydrolase [Muribaculaceae bacterium]|nr:MBL fold metallo-hydrolase [Muribaculaceae bacterium]
MIEITHTTHDGFIVSLPEATLIFDWWRGADYADGDKVPSLPDGVALRPPVYVFISHSHKDHYDPAVFSWAKECADIKYVVSKDVYKRMRHIMSETSVYNGPKLAPEQVACLHPGEVYEDAAVRVEAYPSTDIGNSYAVEAGGKSFFHAGDLNAWVWKDESTQQEINKAYGDFNACLRQIEEGGRTRFDYAFFPVDSRIGRDYFDGAKIFVRRFEVGCFFPMHFGLGDAAERDGRRRDAMRFDLYMNPCRGRYIGLSAWGDRYAATE